MARSPRRGRGRKKIEMKKIENERERGVTLSKRHNGLFKKAGEIATLCGVQIAIILFTIGGKPISYGSPRLQSITDKFLNSNQEDQQQQQQENDFIRRFEDSYFEAQNHEPNEIFNAVNEELVNERKKGQAIQESIKELFGGKTYEEYLGTLGIDELLKLKHKREDLRRNLRCNKEVDLSKIKGPKDFLKL